MPRCLPSHPSVFAPPDTRGLAPYTVIAPKVGPKHATSALSEANNFQALLQQLANEHERALSKLRMENTMLFSENRRLSGDDLGWKTSADERTATGTGSQSIGIERYDRMPSQKSGLDRNLSQSLSLEPRAESALSKTGTMSVSFSNLGCIAEIDGRKASVQSSLPSTQLHAFSRTAELENSLPEDAEVSVPETYQSQEYKSYLDSSDKFSPTPSGKSIRSELSSMVPASMSAQYGQRKVLLCPNEHPVERTDLKSEWRCQSCLRQSPNEARFRCDLCHFDICHRCFDQDVSRENGSIVRCSIGLGSQTSSAQRISNASNSNLRPSNNRAEEGKLETIHDTNSEERESVDHVNLEDAEAAQQRVQSARVSSMLFFEVDDLWKERPSGFVVNKSMAPQPLDGSGSGTFPKSLMHLPQHGSSMSLGMMTPWERFRVSWRKTRASITHQGSFYELLELITSYPSSMHRVFWDIFGTLLIAYDVVILPLKLFEFEDNSFTNFMDWLTLLFWTADIGASFFVGYIDKGITVMDPRKIAHHYFRTWLLIDTIIVSVDWTFKVVRESDSGAGIGRVIRFLRFARTIRLIRLFKLKRMYIAIQDHIESDVASIAVDIAKLILSVLMLAHFISCIWYHLGANPTSSEVGWIYPWLEDDMTHLYTISLEWALTKLLLESIDVHPVNIEERTCSICVAIFGMIVFTSVVSKLTSSMVSLQSMRGDTSRQFWLLRRYFKERSVPKELATRIQRYLEHACSEQEHHVQETTIPILQLLSVQLQDELKYQFHNQELSIHPLFCHISWTSDITMHRLSKLAIARIRLARNDSLIHAGEVAHHMYIVVSGTMMYKNIRIVNREDETSLSKGDWICEASLWVLWIHLGNMHATTESEILSLDAKVFRQVMRTNLRVWQLTAVYAERYVSRLNSQLDVLTDVHNSTKEYWPLSKFIDNFDTNAGLRNWRQIANFSKALSRKASFHRI